MSKNYFIIWIRAIIWCLKNRENPWFILVEDLEPIEMLHLFDFPEALDSFWTFQRIEIHSRIFSKYYRVPWSESVIDLLKREWGVVTS